jgi:hypothetical protein
MNNNNNNNNNKEDCYWKAALGVTQGQTPILQKRKKKQEKKESISKV